RERAGGGLGSSSGAHPLRVRPRRAAARLAPEQRQHRGDVERRAAACIRPRPRLRGALQLRRRRQPLRRRGARVRRRQPATAPRQRGLLLERGRPALGETSARAFRRRGDALSLERRGPAAHGGAPRWSHGELRLGFAYDPFARRVHKRVEAPPDREGRRAVLDTTRFFWDGQRLVHELTRRSRPDHAGAAPRVAATTAAQGDPFAGIASPDPAQSPVEATTPAASKTELRTYCHEDGSYALVAGKLPDGRWAFYVNDAVGTPEALVAADGTVLGSLERHAWRMEEAGGLTPFRFPGQYEDEETGLCYNRYRYYDPELGRFISADPVGLRGGTNVFSYAPNTVTWSDPLGLTDEHVRTCTSARHSPDQQALRELVDEETHGGRRPLSRDDAETILDWADE